MIDGDHTRAAGPVPSGRGGGLVVVAEHEPEVAEMVRRYLERIRLCAQVTASPADAVELLRGRGPAAYVLDLTMPGLDIRLVRRALAAGPPAAVVFLLDARAVRPRGLSSGPGSRRWLVRPFSPRALADSVAAVMMDVTPSTLVDARCDTDHEKRAGKRTGERAEKRAEKRAGKRGGELAGKRTVVRLTTGEGAVLAALERAAGRVLTREELVTAVTAVRARRVKVPGPRVIDVYVTQLRAKLGSDTIRTVRGTGYALRTSWQGKPTANSRGASRGGSAAALTSREVTFPI